MKRVLIFALILALMLGGCVSKEEIGTVVEDIKEHAAETAGKGFKTVLDAFNEALEDSIENSEQNVEARKMFEQIKSALDAKDEEALYELFAPNARDKFPNLRDEIEELVGIYKGQWISNDPFGYGAFDGKQKLSGFTELYITPKVSNMITDQATYTLVFNSVPINKNTSRDVGLWCLNLGQEDGVRRRVGGLYEYTDGSDKVYSVTAPQIIFRKIIVVLDDEDSEALYELFAANAIRNDPNINAEIEKLMDFYKGKWFSNGTYDSGSGEGHKKEGTWVYMEVNPHIKVETDETTYTMIVNAIAVNDENPDDVGLWYLYLENERGENCRIGK